MQSDGYFVTHYQRVTLGQIRRRIRLARLYNQHTHKNKFFNDNRIDDYLSVVATTL